MSDPAAAPEAEPNDPNRYPKGWDRTRVEGLLAHYDGLSDDEWIAEDDAGDEDTDTHCRITIPRDLLPEVRALLAKRAA